jgi:hypothetical protein
VLNDIDEGYLEEVTGSFEGELRTVPGDVAQEETAARLVALAREAYVASMCS